MTQLQQAQISHFVCKKQYFSLKQKDSQTIIVEACICSSIFCYLVPKIFDFGKNVNQSHLFYEYKIDSMQQFQPNVPEEISNLLIPAKGQRKSGYFLGRCDVCKCSYQDYLLHIQANTHKQKVKRNKFNLFIQELKQSIEVQQRQQKINKRKGKFVNKNGTNKKLRFYSKNSKTGKFEKKFKL